MNKEIIKKEETEIQKSDSMDLSQWNLPKILPKDIKIPRIYSMQGMSKPVMNGKAHVGELRTFPSNNLIGGLEDPIELIPVYYVYFFKEYELIEKSGKTEKKYLRKFPLDENNSDIAWQEEIDGRMIQRDRCMELFALLPEEVEKEEAIPYIINFTRSSYEAAKTFGTLMTKSLQKGNPPPCNVVELSVERQTKDDNTFIVMKIDKKRSGTSKEIEEAFKWVKPISEGAVKFVEEDDVVEEETSIKEVKKAEIKDEEMGEIPF